MYQKNSDEGSIIILDVPRGTVKIIILNLILENVRKQGNVVLAVAPSGIATTLLDGGTTAHSTLKISLDIASVKVPTFLLHRRNNI